MRQRITRLPVGILWALTTILVAALPADAAHKKKLDACPAGRFVIEKGPLALGPLATGATFLTVTNGQVTLGGACEAAQAEKVRLQRRKGKASQGASSVRALWRQCAGARVRLTGTIDGSCTRMKGKLRVRKGRSTVTRAFTAVGVAPPTFTVDPTLQPTVAAIPGVDNGPDRAVDACSDASGLVADFVQNEVLVSTSDAAKLDALLRRWGGTLVTSFDLAAAGVPGAPSLHLVRLAPGEADTTALAAHVRVVDVDSRGALHFGTARGLDLFAAAASEAAEHGMIVSLNWIARPSDVGHGSVAEAPGAVPGDVGAYTPDAFQWPYMNRGSAQDIGVAAAWQALAATGQITNQITMAILDGGFQPTDDFPVDQLILGGIGVRNPLSCGGESCPFHGTQVVQTAMGRVDNGFGTAGPAGPIARLIAVQSPALSLDNILRSIRELGRFIGQAGAAVSQARIVNISGGVRIPAAGALFVDGVLGLVFSALRDAGTLVFAAAGNDGKNVDEEDCFIACWEEAAWVPCESDAVICVGGMGWDVTARHPNSNFGTKGEADSVDIYGPYTVWMGPDPENPDNLARRKNGTSFSSPFVAGVAALVWAANPLLSADEVVGILMRTAHVGGVLPRGDHRRVNALGAVAEALGGQVPPLLSIDSPSADTTHLWHNPIAFRASVSDLEGRNVAVSWSSDRDGDLAPGGSSFSYSGLSPGTHLISATATAGGLTSTAFVTITVENRPPIVVIAQPQGQLEFCRDRDIDFEASVADPNNSDEYPFPASQIRWTSIPAGVSGNGFAVRWRPQTSGEYLVAVSAADELGLSEVDSVHVLVRACTTFPPDPSITSIPNLPGEPDLLVSSPTLYHDIVLRGTATDTEDGILSGSALVWTTDRGDLQPGAPDSGVQTLGTGATLAVRLYTQCGGRRHRITLTATDRDGQARSVSRVIEILVLC